MTVCMELVVEGDFDGVGFHLRRNTDSRTATCSCFGHSQAYSWLLEGRVTRTKKKLAPVATACRLQEKEEGSIQVLPGGL